MVLIIFIFNLNQRCKTSVFIYHSHIFFQQYWHQTVHQPYIHYGSLCWKEKNKGQCFPACNRVTGASPWSQQAGVRILVSPLFDARTFACWARGLFPCSLRWGTSPIICRYDHMGNDSETLWGVILGMACQIWIWVVLHCWISVIIIVCPKQTHSLGTKLCGRSMISFVLI